MSAVIPFLDLTPSHESIRRDLDAAWARTVDGNAFTLGEHVDRFESEWANYCGVEHCIGVANGTDALELILRALDIGPGDEVVVPASTFVATAAAVVAVGANPVFADVDPDSMLLTGDQLRSALTDRTAAVIPVHLYGNPVDIDDLAAVAGPAGIAVIEDAAQAHGASSRGRSVGSLGDAAGFSHYPTKNLGAFGDGGSITTDDDALAGRLRRLRNHGRAAQSDQEYVEVGRTSRLDALQASVLSEKLPHLDGWTVRRREIAALYDQHLPGGVVRVGADLLAESSPHLCVVRVPDRDRIRADLGAANIGTSIHYPDPVPRTPAYGGHRDVFPVAEASADQALSLPIWPGISGAQVRRVCSELHGALLRACA
ncbi:MAG: DegT/DnrJ/EryC1/StrS family aminotransferase [Acidimicrobiales bacterium]